MSSRIFKAITFTLICLFFIMTLIGCRSSKTETHSSLPVPSQESLPQNPNSPENESVETCGSVMDASSTEKSTGGMSDINIGAIIDEKLSNICNITSNAASSSNPYDYIKCNEKDFEDIVNLGDDGLNYMLKKFESSKKNGLKEYVMAIACSEILNENPDSKNWSTGREWYNNYIKSNK